MDARKVIRVLVIYTFGMVFLIAFWLSIRYAIAAPYYTFSTPKVQMGVGRVWEVGPSGEFGMTNRLGPQNTYLVIEGKYYRPPYPNSRLSIEVFDLSQLRQTICASRTSGVGFRLAPIRRFDGTIVWRYAFLAANIYVERGGEQAFINALTRALCSIR